MPKDRRIFITLAVDMDRNPKLSDLNGSQKWLIVKAIMHCREFLTDGVIKLSEWRKMGTNRDRIAVESCGVVTIDATNSVAILHDYAEHNQTRAEVEKATEVKKAAGSKGGRARAARAAGSPEAQNGASGSQAAACDLPKQTLKQNQAEEEEEKEIEPTYVGSPRSVSNAPVPAKRSRGMRAVDAMNETARPLEVYRFMHEYEQASQTPIDQKTLSQIETAVTPLIAQGIPPEQVAAGIRAWEASDSFSTTQIAAFVHKAGVKASAQPAAGNAHDAKVVGYLDIGRSLTSQSTEARRELA